MLVRPVIRALVRPPARGATVRGRGGVNLAALLWPTGTEAGMWLDPSDASTAYQDSAGTTAGAIDSPVGKRVSKAGNLSAVLQATATARPVWKSVSGIYSDLFDGGDDNYALSFTGGTLTASMDCFIAVNRSSAAADVLASDPAFTKFFALMEGGGALQAVSGAGTAWNCLVDGVAVGSTNSCTAVQLNAAVTSGTMHVVEVRGLDLSSWNGFRVGGAGSYFLGGSIGGLILCPAQSDANRATVRRELGRKVGLSL